MLEWHPSSCKDLTVQIQPDRDWGISLPFCSSCGTKGPAYIPQTSELPSVVTRQWTLEYEHEFRTRDGHPEIPDHSIRILHLDQTTHEDIIHGTFEVVRVLRSSAETPILDYEAASYTWIDDNGDATYCRRIYLGPDWLALSVTASCFSALQRMRKSTRTVWIDAVCINQSSLHDRNQQVSLMSSIYTNAKRIMAFIGQPERLWTG
jgi:hypothetical protein